MLTYRIGPLLQGADETEGDAPLRIELLAAPDSMVVKWFSKMCLITQKWHEKISGDTPIKGNRLPCLHKVLFVCHMLRSLKKVYFVVDNPSCYWELGGS